MKKWTTIWTRRRPIGLMLALGMSLSACGLLGDSWKEEVLLHDGQKIIVKRSQSNGGSREPGQRPPIKEHSISFSVPGSNKTIEWISEYGKDLGRTNFNLLAVHVKGGTPYVVVSPNGCLSYNKWGRPNPPYVFFRHDGTAWQRIAIEQLPIEFKNINVALALSPAEVDEVIRRRRVMSAGEVKQNNLGLSQPEYKSLLRERMEHPGGERCGEMVGNGKGAWYGVGWFTKQPSLEACLNYCGREDFGAQFCPCNTLFKGK